MKALPIIIALALITGCSSMETREQRCSKYAETYELYLATTAIRPVSKEEVAGAAAAALFLRTYCGWTGPTTTPRAKGSKPQPEVDANGVPIIFPPAK